MRTQAQSLVPEYERLCPGVHLQFRHWGGKVSEEPQTLPDQPAWPMWQAPSPGEEFLGSLGVITVLSRLYPKAQVSGIVTTEPRSSLSICSTATDRRKASDISIAQGTTTKTKMPIASFVQLLRCAEGAPQRGAQQAQKRKVILETTSQALCSFLYV